ncbi:MAG: thioredoxin domain-containing protein [Anaerolineales bacterium]|nr:thioredoxin domain-containing protein [Anaerolineales bacterium]
MIKPNITLKSGTLLILNSLPDLQELKKLPANGGDSFNRLVFEKSPYLLQHAANPVNWYPWGDDAFQEAEKQDKPIFLAIGYATCHWCHVMEKESFEDQDVANLINDNFIPIKVDREERPDIDQIYMAVAQAMTGTGGWPLTVLLTPEKKPFFAGTYFPKHGRYGKTGMMELIPQVSILWREKRDELLQSAEQITDHIQGSSQSQSGELDREVARKAYQQLSERFDPRQGGFNPAPKFPSPHNLIFLLRYWFQSKEPGALEIVEKTLQKMRLGGIFDQVGYGYHRYSTDAAWRLPHFEKMLYDQGMLVLAYAEAYQATGKEQYAQVVREILTYVLRDMTSQEGGFFSAEDADSEGEEGLFYLWTKNEFRDHLGKDSADLLVLLFNMTEEGNFEDESTKIATGRNLLYLKEPLKELAKKKEISEDEILKLWESSRQLLFEIREKRIHPLKDDKILTDWNGLMIAALAVAGRVLNDQSYITAAKKAADFVWKTLRDEDGLLLKRFRSGESGLPAHLDDYAFFVWGLLEIHQADFGTKYLKRALGLNQAMLEAFWDQESGGLFFTAAGQTDLIHRNKEIYDGAIPSGNSVAAMNLMRLGRLTSNPDYEEKAFQIGNSFAGQINMVPQGHTHFLSALLFAYGPSYEVVISGDRNADDTREMLNRLQTHYSPNKVLLIRPQEDSSLLSLIPALQYQEAHEGKATAYVCQNFQCSAPTTDPDEMIKLLGNK